MIDLLKLCGVSRGASPDIIDAALIGLGPDNELQSGLAASILNDEWRRDGYERLHLQYQAIMAASDVLQRSGTTDTHRWSSRLIDFQPVGADQIPDVEERTRLTRAAARYVRQESEARDYRRLVRVRAERAARAGPTGDSDTSHSKQAFKAKTDAHRPEGMSWEDYLAWLESMRQRGATKRNIGPSDGDFVMTPAGSFRIVDANAGDGMTVEMTDAEGRIMSLHWNRLSHPVEFEGRHYFQLTNR